ncbi:anhydro-N-acetylmuramic acid kinase AnmK [Turicibacter sanguinis]|uniref:anhydro-N-acetylmuramic acid kinase AnmK n=1 Tax=Turicibacter sanguinis TaxID=154288 RepID=UPI0021D50617|nr:anhydro-N-acetylmuramic acid kinase AnmK [Turicibacter sanguinis]MCU7202513.1 anhydro-N-acetylmuramic acid kinase AnmK [Turicibacter sanguinis]
MERLVRLLNTDEKYVIGIMSGTSVDGIDVGLVKIKGHGLKSSVELIAFENYPFSNEVREQIFRLFELESSNVKDISQMNFLLGELYTQAVFQICEKANFKVTDVDLVGCHGQTIYHHPQVEVMDGINVSSTFQIGEGSVIAKKTGIVTINDFRVGDMALGGLGAPLVPYPEFLLYRSHEKNIALQNIGGIGNVTILPAGCSLLDVYAFDTGPGNMVMDGVIHYLTDGAQSYDVNGEIAGKGHVDEAFLSSLLEDPYFKLVPPKTTGREYFGKAYIEAYIEAGRLRGLSDEDLVCNATALTAKSISLSYKWFVTHPIDQVIIGGGGSYNETLIKMLKSELIAKVITHEEYGLNSDAKEAIAIAILANETIHGHPSNVPSVTGALQPTILGKIIL